MALLRKCDFSNLRLQPHDLVHGCKVSPFFCPCVVCIDLPPTKRFTMEVPHGNYTDGWCLIRSFWDVRGGEA